MATLYDNLSDKVSKLHENICMWDGVPYRVHCSPEQAEREVTLLELKRSPSTINVDYTDQRFSIRVPSLGYFEKSDGSYVYLTQIPRRSNKDGLTQLHIDERLSSHDFFSSRMRDCILGDHPSPKKALQTLRGQDVFQVAFQRDFALRKVYDSCFKIMFRNKEVGVVLSDGTVEFYVPDVPKTFGLSKEIFQ